MKKFLSNAIISIAAIAVGYGAISLPFHLFGNLPFFLSGNTRRIAEKRNRIFKKDITNE